MITQSNINQHIDSLIYAGCDTAPFMWQTPEGVYGPFLVRQAPNRLLALDERTVLALFRKRFSVNGYTFLREGVTAQQLTNVFGNKFITA